MIYSADFWKDLHSTMASKLTQAEAVERFREQHGDTYDYSAVEYRQAHSTVTVICKEHGPFGVKPIKHWKGQGCPGCRSNFLPVEEILERFRSAHGNRFDYSTFVYAGQHTKSEIICRQHGAFQHTPYLHWTGHIACVPCQEKTLSAEECLSRFRERHGDRFDYSKVVFTRPTVPVVIICRVHGEFTMVPINHWLSSEGCKGCADLARRFSTEQVVERFVGVHGSYYSYASFVYTDMHTVGTVTCNLHGDFPMSPANHIALHGCPSCWQNTASRPEIAWLASIAEATGWPYEGAVKMSVVTGVVDSLFEHPNFGKIVVEYDGNYWHSRPGDLERDTAKTAKLVGAGFPVVRLRAISKGKPHLPDVPEAVNVHISEWPDSEGVQNVVEAIERIKET